MSGQYHMQVLISSPYRTDKNLGRAYNDFFRLLPDDYWGCVTDIDVNFLTPDSGFILHEYVRRFPDAGILTCFTNRISPLSHMQLLGGAISESPDYKHHIGLAEAQRDFLYETTQIQKDISGFLMLVSKRTWNNYPFPDLNKPLGVDTYYGRAIRAAGLRILRMDGLYVWHTYRMMNGINHKEHLKV